MKITKTKSGKYTAQIAITDADGKRHYKRFTHVKKDVVRNLANDYKNTHKVFVESMAFRDALDRYITRSSAVLSPSTLAGYHSNARMLKSRYAAFCGLPCDRITSSDVQTIVDDMTAQGRTVKSIKNRLGLISAVLAAEQCRMPSVRLPKAEVVPYVVPEADDIRAITAACVGRYERMRIPVALAVFGLRRGEICAVTASDLDGPVLHIRKAAVQDDAGHIHIKPPKTSQSVRDVLIPEQVASWITEAGTAWPSTPKALSDTWPHLLRSAGVPHFRFHDCRHFFVSYCHEVLRLSDAQIMKLGGWKTSRVMVAHYRHTLGDGAVAVQSAFSEFIPQ